MTKWFTSIGLAVLLAVPVWAADAPKVERGPSEQHTSACALAKSMASKLGYKDKVKHDIAERNCTALSPTMDAENHAEFMRCCINALEKGEAGATTPKPARPKKPNPPAGI
jgi:hypothetical protein